MVENKNGGFVKTMLKALILLSIPLSTVAAQSGQPNPELQRVVESERAFARKSLEVGSRAAFMMFFADDAVVFRPRPVKYKQAMKDAAPLKNPLETTLEWEPIWADVSSDGSLGYTTGPSVWTDHSPAKRPTYYGFYFSFWKKQSDGDWKVVFDVGTELPGPYSGSRAMAWPAPAHRAAEQPGMTAQELQESLMQAERDFLASVQKKGFSASLDNVLHENIRIYRQKSFPIVGIDSIRAYFFRTPYLAAWEATHCDVAASGDLGYSYGSYTDGDSAATKGYFLHGWKRDARNRWRLVAEITSPLPPEPSKQ